MAADDKKRGFMETSARGNSDVQSVQPGEVIGKWRVVHSLGAGGMSTVYRVERADGLYSQSAALKLMAPGGPHRRDRFDKERQSLALLDHPSIARIIDGGSDEQQRPFLVMELVDGVTIGEWLASKKPTRQSIVEKLCDLCSALGHAHARMILHRDIKPSNILIDEKERLRLVDFGISTSMEEDDDAEARFGVHTPAFAAPEQIEGNAETSATDIFAVGGVAGLLLTGIVPERSESGTFAFDNALIKDKDLAAILIQATRPDPSDRYQTAKALRDDLEAWLAKRPVAARGGGADYKFERFLRRNPLETALGSLALVSLVGGLIVSLVMADQARKERDLAVLERARAEWSLERSDFFNQATSAYADLMQRFFGDEEDVERLTNLMLERVREVQAKSDKDPEAAAFLSYAVGRHFLFRNDYPNSIKVLEPWLNEGYGPEKFQLHGKPLLAIAYRRTGNDEDSIRLQREVERQMTGTFDENTADHAATASNIALITNSPADVQRAEDVLQATIPLQDDPTIEMFMHNQLSKLAELKRDFSAGYASMRRVVDIIEDDELGEISGQDTGRLNLVDYELFHSEDLERAGQLLDRVFADAEIRGESSELARALWYRAEIALRRGEMASARKNFEEAIPIALRFVGDDAPMMRDMRAAYAEFLAQEGDHDAAKQMLDKAGINGSARHRIATARLMLENGGATAASRLMEKDVMIDAEELNSVELMWRYNQLRSDGLNLPAIAFD